MSINELQRIGKILGVKADVDDKTMCLLIQDKIKEKDSEVNKNKFCYHMLKAQNKRLENQIKNLHNEYAENIGIQEHMMVKQSRDAIRKELKNALEENYNLRKSIELYRESELKDKLRKIKAV